MNRIIKFIPIILLIFIFALIHLNKNNINKTETKYKNDDNVVRLNVLESLNAAKEALLNHNSDKTKT